jgi:hypothetical protein
MPGKRMLQSRRTKRVGIADPAFVKRGPRRLQCGLRCRMRGLADGHRNDRSTACAPSGRFGQNIHGVKGFDFAASGNGKQCGILSRLCSRPDKCRIGNVFTIPRSPDRWEKSCLRTAGCTVFCCFASRPLAEPWYPKHRTTDIIRKDEDIMTILPKIFTALALTASVASAAQPASALDDAQKKEFGEFIKQYLIENPEIMLDVQEALQKKQESARLVKANATIAENKSTIFDSKYDMTIGNPKGDVTIVEFFDYN